MSKKLIVFILAAVCIMSFAQAEEQQLPKVLVLGLGGTIAGEQGKPGTLGSYGISKTVEEIVAQVLEIERFARIETEQFSNISTRWLTTEHYIKLSRRINVIFRERSDLAGIVVTHGTNKLDETAFFLHLTVKSERPVVLVAAMRPPTGISPDGPLNLLSAVRVAACPDARNKGTLVVMEERIHSAREVTKIYARSGGFVSNEMGVLGIVAHNSVEFFYSPVRKHTINSDFDIFKIDSLPRVDMSYSYVGSDGLGGGRAYLDSIDKRAPSSSLRPWTPERQKAYENKDPSVIAEKVSAVIAITTGFTPWESRYYEALRKKGIIVASTFPSGGHVSSGGRTDTEIPPMIGVQHLLPTKVRILMMLALAKTRDPAEIQRIFDSY